MSIDNHGPRCGWIHYDDPAWRRCNCGYFYSIGKFEDGSAMKRAMTPARRTELIRIVDGVFQLAYREAARDPEFEGDRTRGCVFHALNLIDAAISNTEENIEGDES